MRRMVDDKEMITIDNRITALEQGGGGSGDAYTKAETDALLLAKLDIYKHFDDDDNPEDFYIKQPQTYSSGIELHASRDDNHHPDYANVLMTPTHVVMMANSANHGDDDDDYTGSIEITDDYVDLDVTDGTNTTTLRVTPSGATINNVRVATLNDIPTLATVATTGDYNDLINKPEYVIAGQKDGTILGDKATAEGYQTTSSGSYSHAEGYNTTANHLE